MHTYIIMKDPGHNRVYYDQSQKLSLTELKIACERFENKCHNIKIVKLAGINYFSFEVDKKITKRDWQILSRLSFAFALFEVVKDNKNKCLIPIEKYKYEYINSKITSILKYSGKTNELFTRMMINIAVLTSDFDYNDNIQLLDPVAGRGTTLFEATVYGFDVFGIEIHQKSVHEAIVFFKKYLEKEKYKHSVAKRKLYDKSKINSSVMNAFEYAENKDDFKSNGRRKKLAIVTGNAINANQYFKKNSFHIIVGDLPYGIAHGNMTKKKKIPLTRNPEELLTASLPEWYKVLKNGGVLVMAWNKFVLPKNKIIILLINNGFKVFSESPYNECEHRVDSSIKRDIFVAKKI